MVKVRKDLTGMKFGRLTVLKQAEDHISKNGQHSAAWWVQCDCGSPPKVLVGGDLTKKLERGHVDVYAKNVQITELKSEKI